MLHTLFALFVYLLATSTALSLTLRLLLGKRVTTYKKPQWWFCLIVDAAFLGFCLSPISIGSPLLIPVTLAAGAAVLGWWATVVMERRAKAAGVLTAAEVAADDETHLILIAGLSLLFCATLLLTFGSAVALPFLL